MSLFHSLETLTDTWNTNMLLTEVQKNVKTIQLRNVPGSIEMISINSTCGMLSIITRFVPQYITKYKYMCVE